MGLFSKVKKQFSMDKTDNKLEIFSPVNGKVETIDKSTDQTFSQKLLGDGIVIFPSDGKIFAPQDAVVESIFPTKHALTLNIGGKLQVLIHLGIDTVKLKGEGFESLVKDGDKVKKGDLLVNMDKKLIEEKGFSTEIILIAMELPESVSLDIETGEKTIEDKVITINNL